MSTRTSKPVSWVQAAKRYGLVRADQMFPEDAPAPRKTRRTTVRQVNRVVTR